MTSPRVLAIHTTNFEGDLWQGGKTYLLNLAKVLSALPTGAPAIVLISAEGMTAFAAKLFEYPVVQAVLSGDRKLVIKNGFRGEFQELYPSINERAIFFPVLGFTENVKQPFYWIPDFQHRHLPEMFPNGEAKRRSDANDAVVAHADSVLLSSEAALSDFHHFHPNTKCKAVVWSFCTPLDASAEPFEDPRPLFGLPETFLYIPNQFWKHKDFETAIRALALLVERGVDVTIAVTGPAIDHRFPGHFEEMMQLAQSLDVADRFRHLGLLPREQQINVFRACAAVLQPSRFEGWSTVIEDAKAIGRPIIASDIPVHREQIANGQFFPVGDHQALARLLADILPQLPPGRDEAAEREASAGLPARMIERAEAFMSALDQAFPIGLADVSTPPNGR